MDFTSPMDHSKHSSISFSTSTASSDSMQEGERDFDTTELNSVRIYVEDQRNVDPEKVMPYMFMLGRGVHNEIPKEIDISSVEILKKALELKVLRKKAIILSKLMLIQERC